MGGIARLGHATPAMLDSLPSPTTCTGIQLPELSAWWSRLFRCGTHPESFLGGAVSADSGGTTVGDESFSFRNRFCQA